MNENWRANLKPPFKKGQSGNPRGFSAKGRRKREEKEQWEKLLASILGEKETKRLGKTIGKDRNAMLLFMKAMNMDQLTRIAKSKEADCEAVSWALYFLTCAKNGRIDAQVKSDELIYGKNERIELTGPDGAPLIPERTLTPAEAKQFLQDLENSV